MADEQVMIVDAANRPVGEAPRSQVRARGLLHRASYILVFNAAGELFVQKRAASKDLYPGWYDLAAGGVLRVGERYRDNAVRELAEELGISGADPAMHGDFYFEEPGYRVWGRLFSIICEGPFRFADAEVESGEFASPQAVLDGRYAPLTPDTLRALQVYRLRAVS